jgi:hypothetical protein
MQEIISFLSANDKLVTAWTAIAALFVSSVSIFIAIANFVMQRRHNRKSVLPIGHVSVGDYENHIFVSLRNDGVGPMIIESVAVSSGNPGEETRSAIIDFMPEGISWTTFVGDVSGRALSAEKSIVLISLEGDAQDDAFVTVRQMVRRALSNLSIKVEYGNIYGKKMTPASRSLSWFRRHLIDEGEDPRSDVNSA